MTPTSILLPVVLILDGLLFGWLAVKAADSWAMWILAAFAALCLLAGTMRLVWGLPAQRKRERRRKRAETAQPDDDWGFETGWEG